MSGALRGRAGTAIVVQSGRGHEDRLAGENRDHWPRGRRVGLLRQSHGVALRGPVVIPILGDDGWDSAFKPTLPDEPAAQAVAKNDVYPCAGPDTAIETRHGLRTARVATPMAGRWRGFDRPQDLNGHRQRSDLPQPPAGAPLQDSVGWSPRTTRALTGLLR